MRDAEVKFILKSGPDGFRVSEQHCPKNVKVVELRFDDLHHQYWDWAVS